MKRVEVVVVRTSLCSRCANEIALTTPHALAQTYNGKPTPRCRWQFGIHLHKCKWFKESPYQTCVCRGCLSRFRRLKSHISKKMNFCCRKCYDDYVKLIKRNHKEERQVQNGGRVVRY